MAQGEESEVTAGGEGGDGGWEEERKGGRDGGTEGLRDGGTEGRCGGVEVERCSTVKRSQERCGTHTVRNHDPPSQRHVIVRRTHVLDREGRLPED